MLHRVPLAVLSRRFGLSRYTLSRHRKHVPPQVKAAMLFAMKPSEVDLDALREREGQGLLSSLVAQRARLQMLSELCFEERALSAAAAVEGKITASLELTAKLIGMFITKHETTHNVLISSDYLQLRSALLRALRPHPAALQAVVAALHQLEEQAASNLRAGSPKVIEAQPC